jgi:lysophospholipase L1-like esterase
VVVAALVRPAVGLASPTGPEPVRVWPLGDSITLGASWPRSAPGGYRTGLDEILTHDGYVHAFVGTSTANSSPTLDADDAQAHDGHGGYRVDQVLRDLDGLAHASTDDGGHWLTGRGRRAGLRPDVALIHLGTNDIVQRWDTRRFPTRTGRADLTDARQRRQFVEDLTARLATLVLRIHALRPRCRLVVATAVPIDLQPLGAVSAAYAVEVRDLVSSLSRRHLPVELADLYAAFTADTVPGTPVVPGLLSKDGIHPTAAGYAVMARIFAAATETG